jgi:hypothetical protein
MEGLVLRVEMKGDDFVGERSGLYNPMGAYPVLGEYADGIISRCGDDGSGVMGSEPCPVVEGVDVSAEDE